MIPPSDKEVGDPGHTDDHNAITAVMVDHQERLGSAEEGIQNSLRKDEPNDVDLNNTENSYQSRVNLPSGDRSGQPDVWGIYRSGQPVSSFNGNGYLRTRSHGGEDVQYIARSYESQSADFVQWINANGIIVARVDSEGQFHGGNVTPGSWTNVILSGLYQWDSVAGNRPQWRRVGDKIEMRGAIRRQDASKIEFSGASLLIGSVPPGSGAPGGARSIQPTQQTSGGFHCQAVVSPDGSIRISGDGAHSPLWVSLDGISYSVTPS